MTQFDSHEFLPIYLSLVKRLVADQFPQWADLAVVPVRVDGHDNRTFRLGDEMSVRVPAAKQYACMREYRSKCGCQNLRRTCPCRFLTPLAMGKPTSQLPWHWSINRWLKGETVAKAPNQ